MRGWYRATVDHYPPPAQVTLERIIEEHVELYRTIPPPGDNILPSVTPDHVDNSVLMEEDVEWEVRILWGHRSGGTSQMRVENLREWLREHREAEAVAVESEVIERTMERDGGEGRARG